jgi:serine/threonine protein kinase
MAKSCPDARQLQELFDGCLSEKEAVRVGAHVDECTTCQDVLQRMTSEVSNIAVCARAGRTKTMTVEPALLEAMANLKDGPLATAEFPEDEIEDFTENVLRPSDRPGVLGLLHSYEIVDCIGNGGMGRVYKAMDPTLNRFVAIKIIAPQLSTSKGARNRFAREARAAAAINHENVVQIYQVSEVDGIPYLVMEYVPGESLQQKIDKREPIDLKDILRIGQQTAAGLAAAHAQGLIHRDIKPPNILLERGEERVKITDFGLARMVDDASLTQSGVLAGTPQYMAPEQARGEAQDYRVDLFSLGSVLYTLCTGTPPFRANTTMAVLRQVSDQEPTPIRTLNPRIPTWLCAIIARLHEKDPADRFQSAKAVAELLGQCLAHMQDPARFPMPEWRDKRSILGRRVLKPTSRAAVLGFLVALVCAVGFWQGWQAFYAPRTEKENGSLTANGGSGADVNEPVRPPAPPDLLAAGVNEKDKTELAQQVIEKLLEQKRDYEKKLLNIKKDLERVASQMSLTTIPLRRGDRSNTHVTIRNPIVDRSAANYGLLLPKSNDSRAVAISPDGSHVAVADGNNQIHTYVFVKSHTPAYWFRTVQGTPVQARVTELHQNFLEVRKELEAIPDSNLWEPALSEALQEYLDRNWKVKAQRTRLEGLQKELNAIRDTRDGKVLPGIRRRLQSDLDSASKELDKVQDALRVQLREGLLKHVEQRSTDALGVDNRELKAVERLIQSMNVYTSFLQPAGLSGELREEGSFSVACQALGCLSYAGGGHYLVGAGEGSELFVWDARTGAELRRIKGHEAPVIKVAVCAETQQVISCSSDGNIRVWAPGSVASTNMTKKNWQPGILDLSVSDSGEWLTFRTSKNEIQCWQVGDENELSHKWTIAAPAECKSLCVTPDQKIGACLCGKKSIQLFNAENGKAIRTLHNTEAEWTCIAFLPHSEALVIGNKNGMLTYHDVDNWTQLGQIKLETSWPVSFSVCPNASIIGVRQSDGKTSLAPLSVQTTRVSLPTYSAVEVGQAHPDWLQPRRECIVR